MTAWWTEAISAQDQLARQRVAFAFERNRSSPPSTITPSRNAGRWRWRPTDDILLKHAFGNYRQLMEDRHPQPDHGSLPGHAAKHDIADPESTAATLTKTIRAS